MPYLNSVTLMGNLTADPELRHVASGEAVAKLRLAVNSARGDDKTRKGEFFDCDIWGGWATNLSRTARKGALVVVEGRLAQDRWVDAKTHQTRSRVKIVARRAFHVVAQFSTAHEAVDEGPDLAAEPTEGAAQQSSAPTPWD